jgi:5-formyltetrahydrofolate cyclo-ligase
MGPGVASGVAAMPSSKAELRSGMLARRAALDPAQRADAALRLTARLLSLPELRAADCVAAYCSFRDEPDTTAILEGLLSAGKRLALPRINRPAGRLDLYEVDSLEDLVPGVWGIREPDPVRCRAVPPGEVDFVLVPGVAFDRTGGRLGYGRGYYDRLLAECHRARGAVPAVAVAFDAQICARVPMEAHDIRLDGIVTETACYRTSV